MICLVVHMHECTLHIRQDFDFILELLTDIVCLPKRSVRIHDHVNLDKVIGATMIRPHGVNPIDLFVECSCLVDDELKEVMGSGLSREKLELFVYRSAPCYDDSCCDDNGSCGIKPPGQFAAARRHEYTKAIDKKVVSMIFPKNVHLTGFIAKAPTIEEQNEFDTKGSRHRYDRRNVEVFQVTVRCYDETGLIQR